MHVCIVHDSKQGNGKHVAHTLGAVFEERGARVTISHVDNLSPSELTELGVDLLVVGAAVRRFTVSPNVKRRLAEIRRRIADEGRPITRGAVFLTHTLPVKVAKSWGNRLQRRLSRSGICRDVYQPWISARVNVQGSLGDDVIEAVHAHAEELWSSMPHGA